MSCRHIQVVQGTEEWFQARSGVITASMFSECRRRLKSGPNAGDFTSAAHDYAFDLAMERATGEWQDKDQYDSYAMRRGRLLEPEARLAYEERYSVLVDVTGFALLDNGLFGASLDGLVGENGSVEIKCFTESRKVREIILNVSHEDVDDQAQGGMWITGRHWCDFILYCPRMASKGLDLNVIHIERDPEYIAELERDMLVFNELVEDYRGKINEKAGQALLALEQKREREFGMDDTLDAEWETHLSEDQASHDALEEYLSQGDTNHEVDDLERYI